MIVEAVNINHNRHLQTTKGPRLSGIAKAPVAAPVAIGWHGLEGDYIGNKKLHGGIDQAVYIYSLEDNHWWAKQLNTDIPPGTFGENLTLKGFNSRRCRIGDRLVIGAVVLEISAPRTPCATLAAKMNDPEFIARFFAAGRPGAYARVLAEGLVKAGDVVSLDPTPEASVTTLAVFEQWPKKEKSKDILTRALGCPIAGVHQSKIEHWLARKTQQ